MLAPFLLFDLSVVEWQVILQEIGALGLIRGSCIFQRDKTALYAYYLLALRSEFWLSIANPEDRSRYLPEDPMRSLVTTRSSLCVILATVVFSLLSPGCSSTLELSSGWTTRELKLTGSEAPWTGATTRIVGPDVHVGVKNDSNNLYVCLITSNRATQMQILALGCTFWFDAEGTKNKKFGIQFPVSRLSQGRRLPARENSQEFQRLVEAAQRQLEIYGPGEGQRQRISEQEGKGIEAHLGYVNETLTCELKVPLQRTESHPYGINVDTAKPLNVYLETGDFSAMRGQSASTGSTQSGGGGRSGGRSGGGGGGGAGAPMGGDIPEPLRHWITVRLASGPTAK